MVLYVNRDQPKVIRNFTFRFMTISDPELMGHPNIKESKCSDTCEALNHTYALVFDSQ